MLDYLPGLLAAGVLFADEPARPKHKGAAKPAQRQLGQRVVAAELQERLACPTCGAWWHGTKALDKPRRVATGPFWLEGPPTWTVQIGNTACACPYTLNLTELSAELRNIPGEAVYFDQTKAEQAVRQLVALNPEETLWLFGSRLFVVQWYDCKSVVIDKTGRIDAREPELPVMRYRTPAGIRHGNVIGL